MRTPIESADEISKKLDAAQAEYRRLRAEDDAATVAAKARGMRLRELDSWGGGEIPALRGRLEAAKRYEADMALPDWCKFSFVGSADVYIIDAVTPKQIKIRTAGEDRVSIYDRETGRFGRGTSPYGPEIPNRAATILRFLAKGEVP